MYKQEVTHVVFSSDGRQAIAVGADSDDADPLPYVRVWELPQESEKHASHETATQGEHDRESDERRDAENEGE